MNKYLPIFSILILSLTIFNNCTSRTYNFLKQGEFADTTFFEEVDFQFIKNMMLVDVEIEGKMYTFVFDTGAEVSLFDTDLVNKITHTKIMSKKVSGAAGVKNKFDVLEIPMVKIGNLAFYDLAVISSDFSAIANIFNCDTEIHGIIGSNLMRKAKCRINYQEEKIWFADKMDSFDDVEEDIVIDLECGTVGSAYISVVLDGVEEQFTFDTGKSTKITTNIKIFDELVATNEQVEFTQKRGLNSITFNGPQYGTTNYTQVKKMEFGEIVLNDQIVEISNSKVSSSLIGNEIWKNYRVTVDWDSCHLYLKPLENVKPDTLFCFDYNISNNKSGNGLKLSSKWLQHSSNLDISNENEIIAIEGIDLKTMDFADYCDFINNDYPIYKAKDMLSIVILVDGKEEKIILKKEKLLPK